MAKVEIWNKDSGQQGGTVGISHQVDREVGNMLNSGPVNWIAMASVGLDGNNGDGPLTQQSVFLIGKHTSAGPGDFIFLGAGTFNGQALRYSLWATPVAGLAGVAVDVTSSTIGGVRPIGYANRYSALTPVLAGVAWLFPSRA